MADEFERRDKMRFEYSEPFLRGHGAEIGAGNAPQRLPEGVTADLFDLRTGDELAHIFDTPGRNMPAVFPITEIRERFPSGADFLIAHHVLEHCPNPVGTLIEWAGFVKDKGVVVISLPSAEACSDDGRLVPPAEHILLDYIFDRDFDCFESREHAYSCIAGWMNDQGWHDWLPMTKKEVSERAHQIAHSTPLDVHWHAYTPELMDTVFRFASYFSPRAFSLLAVAHPHLEGKYRTDDDIFCLFQVLPADASRLDASADAAGIEDELAAARRKLQIGLARLNRADAVLRSAQPEPMAPLAEAPGVGRHTMLEKYCRALTDFDETGLRRTLETIEGEFGMLPPEPPTSRGKLGARIVRTQAKALWWLVRALHLRDDVLAAVYRTLGRQLEAQLGFQAEMHTALRDLRARLDAIEGGKPSPDA